MKQCPHATIVFRPYIEQNIQLHAPILTVHHVGGPFGIVVFGDKNRPLLLEEPLP